MVKSSTDSTRRRRWVAAHALSVAMLAGGILLSAQGRFPYISPMRHNTGQSVVPSFDGYLKNADGTVDLVFGYYSRNYADYVSVPVGPDNSFSPGPADRGQPTLFYPQLNREVFEVRVPKDWGKQELVWTITVNGVTEKTYASTAQDLELSTPDSREAEAVALGQVKSRVPNQAPTLKLEPSPATATVATPVTFSAVVTDDGNPPAPTRQRRRLANRGDTAFPTLHKGQPGVVNVPILPPMPRLGGRGLSAGWVLWRGPAMASFAPEGYQRIPDPKQGKVSTKVTFNKPGAYVLRAQASDGQRESAIQDVAITVTAPAVSSSQSQR